jgi:hypothetical protein
MIIIDRFESSLAVLETDDGMINVERSLLPENAAEGDVLVYDGSWTVDKAATEQRRSRTAKRLKRLLNKTDKRGKND